MTNLADCLIAHCKGYDSWCRSLKNELCEYAYWENTKAVSAGHFPMCTIRNPMEWKRAEEFEERKTEDKK